ncbi:MAG: hypothetical protein Q8P18_19570 [Pseudomonadota bacterium]|nr:hypothetical protein [Pseudomonadota bacterium]
MILALFLACSGPRSAAELPVADPPSPDVTPSLAEGEASTVEGDPSVGTPGQSPLTPTEAYLGCKDRVEGVETAGECTTDADCAKTGCSQEVCVAKANAGDVMTTCEILTCFSVLEACGCHEGLCSWSLADAMPALGRIKLPPKPPAEPAPSSPGAP